MASRISSSSNFQCLRWISTTSIFNRPLVASTRQQVRGKKNLVKVLTVKVRLLKDIPRYGPQGAIIPITAGRMRNEFYPRKMAEYVTAAQLRKLGLQDAALERDPTFGISQQQIPSQQPKETEAPITVAIDLLKPDHATKVVSLLLPPNIDFYRPRITSAQPTPQRHSPSIPSTSAVSVAAQEAARPKALQKTSIYGSVTTADIAENIRAVLAEDDVGARVVLTSEDITFVEEGEEKDRVKHLGVFEIDIRIKGATENIRRTIKVNAQE